MTKKLIVVAGNIGAGKTSLTERLGERLGWQTGFESVSDNPYLPDFYADMRAWSFHLQIFFLGHRAEQYLEQARSSHSVVLDRSIYEDAHIFARALHHLGNLDERDYLSYQRVFNLLVATLPPPNLLIFLKAPVHVLVERIRLRGRPIESGITSEYLTLLESFYDDWMVAFDLCPVLTIHTGELDKERPLDFVHNSHHLDIVVDRIQDKLSGKEDVILTSN
ncbi:MAG TPA: deoxynucleoside kinase [Anaerolineales bacterium]|nr:deoxynucleoside kinase [Anaerolineales bacterium]